MFRVLGNFVSRFWPLLLAGWLLVLGSLKATAPNWADVVEDGEFAFLPAGSPSRLSEKLFQEAWGHPLASSIAIVVRHESHKGGLTDTDKQFIEKVLKPRLEQIVTEETRDSESPSAPHTDGSSQAAARDESPTPRVRTFSDKSIGRLLVSEDNKASLVLVELSTEFLDQGNAPLIERIEELTASDGELHQQQLVPPGLHLDISGSATVGRDMIRASAESAQATELWTMILVIVLLTAIYRTPLLAIIPLMTVILSVETAVAILAHLAAAGVVELFRGIEIYVTVLSYGAGVDYCLFLIARYKEELDEGADVREGVANALARVGAALTASAGTVICGIGMMSFATFGKFRDAGHGITLGLFIVLLASLTFTPALLRLVGPWAFWPHVRTKRLTATAGWISASRPMGRLLDRNYAQAIWDKVGQVLLRKPGTILLGSVAVLTPFAVVAVLFFDHLSYGLLRELPRDFPSVQGARAVQNHFPAGITGEVTILLKNAQINFASDEGTAHIKKLVNELLARRVALHLADVRAISHPFGTRQPPSADSSVAQSATSATTSSPNGKAGGKSRGELVKRMVAERIRKQRVAEYYISTRGPLKGQVTRVDLVLQDDPFSRNSISQFENIMQTLRALLPEETQLFAIGPTADIRDLKTVTDSDQIKIDLLVVGGVFLILVILLRKPAVSLYLVVSVFFSFLVTLGVTFTVFWFRDPAGFAGLDWKVPMFLFTILIAVGEDYNIFLMTRIEEEQRRHGDVEGIVAALRKTGSIISSCGIIMAGTFSSLTAGSLTGMDQLGFALAFGVLLDTFVVRPILVPAYLILLYSGRLGVLGRFLGAKPAPQQPIVGDQPAKSAAKAKT